MAKTLRVRTRAGWDTKPAPDTDVNRLTAEEIDDNFVALDQQLAAIESYEVGQCALMADDLAPAGWLNMDGTTYLNSTYPLLGDKIDGIYDFTVDITSSMPSAPYFTHSVAFSPDDKWVAYGHDGAYSITVVDLSDFSTASTMVSLWYGADVAFHPDSTFLAMVAPNESPYFEVYNVPAWTKVAGTPTLAGAGRHVSFKPDGSQLAIAHANTPFLTILETSGWTTVAGTPTPAALSDAWCAEFSPDGSMLAVGIDQSPWMIVYNTNDWSIVSGAGDSLTGDVRDMSWSPNGQWLALTGSPTADSLVVKDTSTWALITLTISYAPLTSLGYDVYFSPDSKYLAYSKLNNPELTIVETTGWTDDTNWDLPERGQGVAWSPDAQYIGVATRGAPGINMIRAQDQTQFIVPTMTAPSADLVWMIKAE